MDKVKIEKLDIRAKKDFLRLSKDCPGRHIDDHDFYGAYENQRLIGGIVINPKPDWFHCRSLGLFPEVIVEFFFVLKEYRNQGIGKKLFNMALKYKSIGLRTGGMTTDIAKKFYARLGFKIVKEKKGLVKYWYYENDSVTLKKDPSKGSSASPK